MTKNSILQNSSENEDNRPKLGRLWQIPMFFIGLLAFVCVWVGRPLWHEAETQKLNRKFAELRTALDTPQDPHRAVALGEALVERVLKVPNRAGEAHYLLGSAYLALASRSAGTEVDAALQRARWHLEQAWAVDVPEPEHARMIYRLGKSWYLTKADPQMVIECIGPAIEPGADNRAEGYEMLSHAYLRLPRPNLQAALEANQRQLALSTDSDANLAAARLLGARLLIQLHQGSEARKALARIQPGVAPDIYAQAILYRAESCQDDKLWHEAAPLWEEILKAPPRAPDQPGRSMYLLGQCYRHLNRPEDARQIWEKALLQDPESSQAAAFGLAELQVTGTQPETALPYYEQGLRGVTGLTTFHNRYLELKDAQALFQLGCGIYTKADDFDCARRLARLYEKLSPPGASQEMVAKAVDAWAKHSLKLADAGGPEAPRFRREAIVRFREAGIAYETVAGSTHEGGEQLKWLRLSADRYLKGQHYHNATIVLKRLLELEKSPEHIGETWLKLAEAYGALKNSNEATAAFHKCIEYPGSSAYRARFHLAQDDIQNKRWDDAEAQLQQLLELMRPVADDDLYEKALFALADLLLQRSKFRMATLRLQEVLERYPGHPRSVVAREQLADCYRHLAIQEDLNFRKGGYPSEESQLHYREQRRLWLQMAVAHYQKLADDLTGQQSKGHLSELEDQVMKKAEFAVAECQFELGHYEAAVELYDRLAPRHVNQLEALIALQQVTRCYWVLRDRDKAHAAVEKLRDALKKIPDKAFRGQAENETRPYWDEWLEWATKQ